MAGSVGSVVSDGAAIGDGGDVDAGMTSVVVEAVGTACSDGGDPCIGGTASGDDGSGSGKIEAVCGV